MGRLGLEPRTNGLKVRCATIALAALYCSSRGTRTPGIRYVKATLYQLSYAAILWILAGSNR